MPKAVAGSLFFEEEVDPETRLKLDALYAISDAKQDEKSFLALKEVALDTRQKERLRYAALDIISGYKKYDVMPIYTEIAKKDTSQNMQSYAIDYISYNSKDKNKSVAVLIDLFNATPKSRSDQKRRIFYAIAEVGNDNAVDFLATVARNNDDYELRREAVFYLGTIGGEKSRTALYEILMGKSK
jgi:HEAT repeat protein